MKALTLTIFLSIGIISCSPKILQQSSFEKKCFRSENGHLFAENEICFYTDSNFNCLINGPSTFISIGKWKYNRFSNEIELTSATSSNSNSFRGRVDTMWINLTGKKIHVKSGSQIVFEDIIYRFK